MPAIGIQPTSQQALNVTERSTIVKNLRLVLISLAVFGLVACGSSSRPRSPRPLTFPPPSRGGMQHDPLA